MEKICTKCKLPKEVRNFNKSKETKDGLTNYCKLCLRERTKNYRLANNEKIKTTRKKNYDVNRDKLLSEKKKYTDTHKTQKSEYDVQYRLENKEKIAALKKAWQNKKKDEPIYKITHNLRRRIHKVLKGENKSNSTVELIGCTIEIFINHIESLFKPGMTWENYGKEWHIDHIKQCCTFDLSIPEQQKICFNYSNQRPLWKIENLKRPKRT